MTGNIKVIPQLLQSLSSFDIYYLSSSLIINEKIINETTYIYIYNINLENCQLHKFRNNIYIYI